MKMKFLLTLGITMMLLGCGEVSIPDDQGEVMKACAAACNIGGSKMSKWNVKDGCVCDTSSHPKAQ
jgi:uncharacterized protein YceK